MGSRWIQRILDCCIRASREVSFRALPVYGGFVADTRRGAARRCYFGGAFGDSYRR
jgi:hypothetical protein